MLYDKTVKYPYPFEKYWMDCRFNIKWIHRIMEEKGLSFHYPKQLESKLKFQAYYEWRKQI